MTLDVDDAPVDGWPEVSPRLNPCEMFPYGLPQIVPIPGTDSWRLTEEWAYRDAKGRLYVVPEGFETDGASIPAPFWAAVGHPYDPDYVCAAVLHDFLWRKCKTWRQRTAANRLFREILQRQGTASHWDRFALSTGVWLGKLGNALAFWR